jgi:hypothetical protein
MKRAFFGSSTGPAVFFKAALSMADVLYGFGPWFTLQSSSTVIVLFEVLGQRGFSETTQTMNPMCTGSFYSHGFL